MSERLQKNAVRRLQFCRKFFFTPVNLSQRFGRFLLFTAFAIPAVRLLHQGLRIDPLISDLFFGREALALTGAERWMWPKSDPQLTFWLHTAVKWFFVTTVLGIPYL